MTVNPASLDWRLNPNLSNGHRLVRNDKTGRHESFYRCIRCGVSISHDIRSCVPGVVVHIQLCKGLADDPSLIAWPNPHPPQVPRVAGADLPEGVHPFDRPCRECTYTRDMILGGVAHDDHGNDAVFPGAGEKFVPGIDDIHAPWELPQVAHHI